MCFTSPQQQTSTTLIEPLSTEIPIINSTTISLTNSTRIPLKNSTGILSKNYTRIPTTTNSTGIPLTNLIINTLDISWLIFSILFCFAIYIGIKIYKTIYKQRLFSKAEKIMNAELEEKGIKV